MACKYDYDKAVEYCKAHIGKVLDTKELNKIVDNDKFGNYQLPLDNHLMTVGLKLKKVKRGTYKVVEIDHADAKTEKTVKTSELSALKIDNNNLYEQNQALTQTIESLQNKINELEALNEHLKEKQSSFMSIIRGYSEVLLGV